jgi:hypothetical protein
VSGVATTGSVTTKPPSTGGAGGASSDSNIAGVGEATNSTDAPSGCACRLTNRSQKGLPPKLLALGLLLVMRRRRARRGK